jgi:hypothetical protein
MLLLLLITPLMGIFIISTNISHPSPELSVTYVTHCITYGEI